MKALKGLYKLRSYTVDYRKTDAMARSDKEEEKKWDKQIWESHPNGIPSTESDTLIIVSRGRAKAKCWPLVWILEHISISHTSQPTPLPASIPALCFEMGFFTQLYASDQSIWTPSIPSKTKLQDKVSGTHIVFPLWRKFPEFREILIISG